MDTRTGQIITLDEVEAKKAEMEWDAWMAGLLKEMPKFAPIEGDKIPVRLKRRRRKRTKATRSYKDFCNG
jgi:hypothetical protein